MSASLASIFQKNLWPDRPKLPKPCLLVGVIVPVEVFEGTHRDAVGIVDEPIEGGDGVGGISD
jgi:hypothetical protein